MSKTLGLALSHHGRTKKGSPSLRPTAKDAGGRAFHFSHSTVGKGGARGSTGSAGPSSPGGGAGGSRAGEATSSQGAAGGKATKEAAHQAYVERDAAGSAAVIPRLLDVGIQVVVDHFGLPDSVADASDLGFRQLLEFDRSQQVWVKLSAPYRLSADGMRLASTLNPWLRDVFGLERLMWGSDWPQTQFEARTKMRADIVISLLSSPTMKRLVSYSHRLVASLASD